MSDNPAQDLLEDIQKLKRDVSLAFESFERERDALKAEIIRLRGLLPHETAASTWETGRPWW